MKRHLKFIVLLISILSIGLIYYFSTYASELHEPINVSDVESIKIWGRTSRIANSDEKRDIIKWFNSTSNIRENKDFAGTTPDAGIVIKLQTGNEILILKSGTDFEVQRTNSSGVRISYWGEQSNIRNILYSN
jgi:hypothetical protein